MSVSKTRAELDESNLQAFAAAYARGASTADVFRFAAEVLRLRAELAAAESQRDALNEKLLEAQHALGAIDCALNPPHGGNYTQRQVLEIIKGLMGDKAHCSELVQQVKEARAQRDAAVEALDRYGKHERACINQGAYNTDCVCGFSAALLRAKEQR